MLARADLKHLTGIRNVAFTPYALTSISSNNHTVLLKGAPMLYSIVTLNESDTDDFDFTVTDEVVNLDGDEDEDDEY